MEDSVDRSALIGRDHHLAALADAFAASRRETVTMLVHGPSGMGRSALLRRFLEDVAARGALVLEGRSYPCPRAPHDALMPLVDGLAEHLAALPATEVEALLPADVSALARLFPALRRAPGVADAPEITGVPDPHEAQRRGVRALRDVLGRLAARAPLVLVLDDLHWADAESAAILFGLVVPPAAPPLLLVAAYRSEDTASIGLVTALRRRMAHGDPVGDVRELLVGALAPRQVGALARAFLPADRVDDADEVFAIDHLSGGSPLLACTLARHPRAADMREPGDVLAVRLAALPAPARTLLEVIAAAGRPTPLTVVERAAALHDPGAALAALLDEELVRIGEAREVETAQALIREAALAHADPEALSAHHRALASLTDAESDTPLFHLEAAGDAAGARAVAEAAAARASAALAWGRAAAHYRRAVAGAPAPRPLLPALGDALALDGRTAEAGRAYLDACAGAPPGEAQALRLRAFEALLTAGHVEGGLAVARELLAGVGLTLPGTPPRAAASLLYRRARLSLRGLDFEARPGAAGPSALAHVDVCGAVGERLHEADLVRAADFQARHLLAALDAGDPDRAARALASAGIAAAMEGRRGGRERAAHLVARASAVAERAGDSTARARVAAAQVAVTFHQHRFADAAALAERAVGLLRRTSTGAVRELGAIAGRWLLPALHLLGRIDELVFLLPDWLDELTARGAHAEVSSLRARAVPRLLLARDQPLEARREADGMAAEVFARGGVVPRWDLAVAAAAAALYQGDGVLAHHEVSVSWPDLERSHLLRLEPIRLEALHLRAGVALAAAAPETDGRRLLTEAEQDARTLRREGCALGSALAAGLLAAVALGRGHESKALGLFSEAESGFAALEMPLHEAAMRRRRGELLMGEDGWALCREADGAMASRGVIRPDRLVAVLAPRPE